MSNVGLKITPALPLHLTFICINAGISDVNLSASVCTCADWAISPEIIDEQARPDEVVEVIHHGTGQKEHLLPFSDIDHLALDVESLIHILENTLKMPFIHLVAAFPTALSKD